MVEVSVVKESYFKSSSDGSDQRKNTICYFFRHPETFYLEETSKYVFLESLDVDNPRYEIVKNMTVFRKEISLSSAFARDHPWIFRLVTNDSMYRSKVVCWIIGLVLNAIILGTYSLKEESSDSGDEPVRRLNGEGWQLAINITSYIFAFLTFMITLFWGCFKWKIEYKVNREKFLVKHPSMKK